MATGAPGDVGLSEGSMGELGGLWPSGCRSALGAGGSVGIQGQQGISGIMGY